MIFGGGGCLDSLQGVTYVTVVSGVPRNALTRVAVRFLNTRGAILTRRTQTFQQL